jgi:hypothetical protein
VGDVIDVSEIYVATILGPALKMEAARVDVGVVFDVSQVHADFIFRVEHKYETISTPDLYYKCK